MVDINTTSAVLFVVFASCFLILIYKLMSYWFIELLVVLFCIGGAEVRPNPFCMLYIIVFFCYMFSLNIKVMCVLGFKWFLKTDF